MMCVKGFLTGMPLPSPAPSPQQEYIRLTVCTNIPFHPIPSSSGIPGGGGLRASVETSSSLF